MKLTKKIRQIRAQKHLKQTEIAQALHLFPPGYSRLERRGRKMTVEQLEQIARALDVTVAELLEDDTNPSGQENSDGIGNAPSLIGMHGFIWEDNKLKYRVQIIGKVGEFFYLVQAISLQTGESGVIHVVHLNSMQDWDFWENESMANRAYEDYIKHRKRRFKLEVPSI